MIIFLQLLFVLIETLRYIKNNNYVHFDIKDGNIGYVWDDEKQIYIFKLFDFGISQKIKQEQNIFFNKIIEKKEVFKETCKPQKNPNIQIKYQRLNLTKPIKIPAPLKYICDINGQGYKSNGRRLFILSENIDVYLLGYMMLKIFKKLKLTEPIGNNILSLLKETQNIHFDEEISLDELFAKFKSILNDELNVELKNNIITFIDNNYSPNYIKENNLLF